MGTKFTLICDLCEKENDSAYGWARINISGSTNTVSLSPNQHYDICSDCWVPFRRMIHKPKVAA